MNFPRIISLAFFILIFTNGNCRKEKENDLNTQIISYLITQSTTNTNNPCLNFSITESACVRVPESSTITCSDSEIDRLKSLIEPTSKRSNEILNKFFTCWKNCNVIFNSQESICNGEKFSTNKLYRDSQRSISTNSASAWGICMNRCNKGEDVESGLNTTGASYPKSAY
jgi:hypothetical protein